MNREYKHFHKFELSFGVFGLHYLLCFEVRAYREWCGCGCVCGVGVVLLAPVLNVDWRVD